MASEPVPSKLGEWAFTIGVVVAILLGFFPNLDSQGVSTLFLLLGLIVGIVNITKKETSGFLLASIALLVVGTGGLQDVPGLGSYFSQIFYNITSFVAPAVVIVALKTVMAAESGHHFQNPR